MHEWMAAADLLVSRAGGGIVAESLNCGLPILVFDAPPGNERRFCQLIEKCWHTGYWVQETRGARHSHRPAASTHGRT